MLPRVTLPALFTLGVILLFGWLGWQLLANAPVWYRLGSYTLDTNQSPLNLGYQELGQHLGEHSADYQHVQLRYEPASGWWLANASANKTLLYKTLGDDPNPKAPHRRLRQWLLAQGDVLTLDKTSLLVKALGSKHLVLENTQTQQQAIWQSAWLGGDLQVSQQTNFAGCHDKLDSTSLFYLGGQVQCATRWKLPELPSKTALIKQTAEGYLLAPFNAQVPIQVKRAGTTLDLMQMSMPVHTANNPAIFEVIVGKTSYKLHVNASDNSLRFEPTRNIHLFSKADIPQHDAHSDWGRFTWPALSTLSLWPGWTWLVLLSFGVLLTALLATVATDAKRRLGQGSYWLVNFGLMLLPLLLLWLGLVWGANLPAAFIVTATAWILASLVLWQQGYLQHTLGWLWALALSLVAYGLIVQMQLALGASDTSWHVFATRQTTSLLVMAWIITVFAVLPTPSILHLWELITLSQGARLRPILSWLPPLVVLVSLLILGQVGSEAGVAGIQPAEFAKLVLALLLAIGAVTLIDLRTYFQQSLAVSNQYQSSYWWQSPRFWRWLRLVGWTVFTLIMALGVLGAVRDFSPILILFFVSFAFAWQWRQEWPRTWRWLILLMPCLAISVLVLAWFLPDTMATLLASLQGERILVWRHPWAYPDLGLQLQRSLQAINSSAWFNQQWYGSNGAIMQLPAIQNDFILAFVFAKWGVLGSLVLLILQLLWLGLFFGLYQTLLALKTVHRQRFLTQQLLAWLLYALAWLQITHWLISWCNALGLLPIMGQPMTWLSSGNSHLFALGLPSLLVALVAARYVQTAAKDYSIDANA